MFPPPRWIIKVGVNLLKKNTPYPLPSRKGGIGNSDLQSIDFDKGIVILQRLIFFIFLNRKIPKTQR
jgi:hypothetical protein